jgi:thiamine-phosphate pyrophosphorylase
MNDTLSLYRILDANLNRTREALRVLEDYCRFVQNHSLWCAHFKEIRHSLVLFENSSWKKNCIHARDIQNDVGKTIEGTYEYQRTHLNDLVKANLNRLKESLRVLEEYTKLLDPALASLFEKNRYLLYQLEKEMLSTLFSKRPLKDCLLYVLLSSNLCGEGSLLEVAQQLVEGGADILQLREKSKTDAQLFQEALRLSTALKTTPTLFFINDRPDIASLVQADGVHLGQEDLPLSWVKKQYSSLLVGVSTHTPKEAQQADLEKADYIAVGPLFPSKTKKFESFPGLAYAASTAKIFSGSRFAIGGIDESNLPEVLAQGISRIAVSSTLLQAKDRVKATQRLKTLLLEHSSALSL